jgi:hypothetical protein
VIAAVASNSLFLHDAYKSYRSGTELVRADLSALEIARDTVDPSFYIDEEFADTGFVHIDAGSYFAAVDEFGSPAYTLDELQASPEAARFAADKVLLNALQVALEPVPASLVANVTEPAKPAASNSAGLAGVPENGCITTPGGAVAPLLSLPPGGATVVAGGQPVTGIKMRRFATGEEFPVDFGTGIPPGEATTIPIPVDASTVPWKLQLEGGAATVCGPGA